MMQFLSSLGISVKAAAALAVVGAGLVTAAAVVPTSAKLPNPGHTASATSTPAASPDASPSPEPSASSSPNHGVLVTQAVASCKAALTAGQHGIGQCVEKVASSNGQQHRAAAAQHGSDHAPASPGSPSSSH